MLLRVECEALCLLMVATTMVNSSAELLGASGRDNRKVCSAIISVT